MKDFVTIDFETANPKRVSACALGYATIEEGKITETGCHLIKPVGGHAEFQSKIHGLTAEDTDNKPNFGELYSDITSLFNLPVVGYSLFDKQVLNALSNHFNLGLFFNYTDACSVAKECLPNLKKHKLKIVAKHLELPLFKHHDAEEDAVACAKIFLTLSDQRESEIVGSTQNDVAEFQGLVHGILADDVVNYKEAYQLLYWLEDHPIIAQKYDQIYRKATEVLYDDHLDKVEAEEIKALLIKNALPSSK